MPKMKFMRGRLRKDHHPVATPPGSSSPDAGQIGTIAPLPTSSSTVTSLAALRGVASGATMRLQAGSYSGTLDMRNLAFASPTTIVADGCTLTGFVLLQNTSNLIFDGLTVQSTGADHCVDITNGCSNITLRRMTIRGLYLDPMANHGVTYSNVNGIQADDAIGNFTVEDCLIEHVNRGVNLESNGDVTFNRNTIQYTGGDGVQCSFAQVNSKKEFLGNTYQFPMKGLDSEHQDAIQFTAIGVDSTTDYNNLVFKWNVCFENDTISLGGQSQGFTSFIDSSIGGLGRRWNNAVVENNYTMTSDGSGMVFANIKGGFWRDNTCVGYKASQTNTPFFEFGSSSSTNSPVVTGNLAPAKSAYSTVFFWDGTSQVTSRADLFTKLTRR